MTMWWRWNTLRLRVAIDAPHAIIPSAPCATLSLEPNFGGEVMVVSLGCEKLQPERLLPPAPSRGGRSAAAPTGPGRGAQSEYHVGFHVDGGVHPAALLHRAVERAPPRNRAGLAPGGGRAGAATRSRASRANPAVGFCTDLLVRAGASVMFGPTEVRDGIAADRPAPPPPRSLEMIREMAWYDAYPGSRQRGPQCQHDAG